MFSTDQRSKEDAGSLALEAGECSAHMMNRRSLLRGIGLATGAGLAGAIMKPSTARAHGGGYGGGNGYGGGQSRIDAVMGLLGAIETLDPDEIASWLADDALYQNTGLLDIAGKAAVAGFFGLFAPVFESFAVDVVNIACHGDLVCTERLGYFTVSEDSPMGYPGAELVLKVASWHEVQAGKVVRWSDYWDTHVFSTTLGIPLPRV